MSEHRDAWTVDVSVRRLKRAARHVVFGRTAAGIDDVSPVSMRERWALAAREAVRSRAALRDGTYEFMPAARYLRPRIGAPPREQAVLTVRDGMVVREVAEQTAWLWNSIPSWIRGGRPGTSIKESAIRVGRALADFDGEVFRFDLADAFGSAPFDVALAVFRERSGRDDIADLLLALFGVQHAQGFRGLVEGLAISPLLLALVLAEDLAPVIADHAVLAELWFDDGLALLKPGRTANELRKALKARLRPLGMRLHREKTAPHRWQRGERSSFGWVGFEFAADGRPVLALPTEERLINQIINVAIEPDEELWPAAKVALISRAITSWGGTFGIRGPQLEDLDRRIGRIAKELPGPIPKLNECSGRISWTSSDVRTGRGRNRE